MLNNVLPQLQQDAIYASQKTGLLPDVVETQFVGENGWTVPSTNNFGNISYTGAPGETGYFVSSDGTKIATFSTPQSGLDAYVNLMNSKYSSVEQAKTAAGQIKALQQSPWDAAHYQNLPSVYNSVVKANGGTSTLPTGTFSASSLPSDSSTGLSFNPKILEYVLIGIGGILLLGAVF